MGTRKVGEGEFTLYLEECPQCGSTRTLDQEKFYGMLAMLGGGVLLSAVVGAPVVGAMGAIGLIKLAVAGTIGANVAVQLIKANYRALEALNKKKLYTCRNCGSTALMRPVHRPRISSKEKWDDGASNHARDEDANSQSWGQSQDHGNDSVSIDACVFNLEDQGAASAAHAHPASSHDLLEPIESVAYQTWAWAWGHISQGHPVDDIIGRVQIDRARWNRVHPVFMQRMAQDDSHTIIDEFRKYAGTSAQPAQPQSPSYEPAPIERWVEVCVALELGQNKGWDSTQILANFGMSAQDWGGIHAWWSQMISASAHDNALQARCTQLRDFYISYYSSF